MTGDSKQPSREAVQTGCISDIPRLKHALEQIEGMASFKAALPFLKPFMRLLKIETHGIDASLQNIEQLRADIEELRQLPDAFNDLLAERGWIIYHSLSIDVAKEAVRIARTGDLAAAEAHLGCALHRVGYPPTTAALPRSEGLPQSHAAGPARR